jgi:hypothetical protein
MALNALFKCWAFAHESVCDEQICGLLPASWIPDEKLDKSLGFRVSIQKYIQFQLR